MFKRFFSSVSLVFFTIPICTNSREREREMISDNESRIRCEFKKESQSTHKQTHTHIPHTKHSINQLFQLIDSKSRKQTFAQQTNY